MTSDIVKTTNRRRRRRGLGGWADIGAIYHYNSFDTATAGWYLSIGRFDGEARMAKANVDPTELRRFAADLARFNMDLQGLVSSLHAKMQGLEATWRDQEQKKFAEAFAQTTKALGNFLEASHQHVIFLGKKATLVEDYLKQR
jgi:uncharacterized protein YukE